MMNAWISFAWTLDPNGPNGEDSTPFPNTAGQLISSSSQPDGSSPFLSKVPTWPKYGSQGKMLQINLTDYTIITDNYRRAPISFLNSAAWTDPLAL